MGKKIKVGILFGGKSAEHEVSLQSAKNVIEFIDRNRFEVMLLAIDKHGDWFLMDEIDYLDYEEDPKNICLLDNGSKIVIVPGKGGVSLMETDKCKKLIPPDVIFPVMHGTYSEDGAIQGFLKLMNIPFVGADIAGSAVGMDKDIMKRLLRDANIPIADFFTYHAHQKNEISTAAISEKLGMPLFIKPANLGSSVGISKAKTEEELKMAIDLAFTYDDKIIVEEFIEGREIECAVLGNEHPRASVPGEIIPQKDFYSYEAKYLDEKGAILKMPAEIAPDIAENVRNIAVKTFQTLACEGMARVDMFLTSDGRLILNEINTIPGFTKISMYPELWELSGIPYTELISELIHLALERHERKKNLKTVIH